LRLWANWAAWETHRVRTCLNAWHLGSQSIWIHLHGCGDHDLFIELGFMKFCFNLMNLDIVLETLDFNGI
jgi:hypothetical protein